MYFWLSDSWDLVFVFCDVLLLVSVMFLFVSFVVCYGALYLFVLRCYHEVWLLGTGVPVLMLRVVCQCWIARQGLSSGQRDVPSLGPCPAAQGLVAATRMLVPVGHPPLVRIIFLSL